MGQTILITGANGSISSAIISLLKNSGNSIRALVRNADKGEVLKKYGAEIVVGDLEEPGTLGGAFADVDTVFILASAGPRAPEHCSNALWAARQASVKRVVRLSAFGAAHDSPTINSRLHALSDNELIASGMPFTILKPHFFMQNLTMAIRDSIQDGVLRFPLGEGKLALIDTTDIAAFAARVLITEEHENKTYTLTGPKSISLYEVASAISETTGKPVKYEPVPVEQALKVMSNFGVDSFTLNVLRDYFNAYSENWGDSVSDDFPTIMGRASRGIDQFLTDFDQGSSD